MLQYDEYGRHVAHSQHSAPVRSRTTSRGICDHTAWSAARSCRVVEHVEKRLDGSERIGSYGPVDPPAAPLPGDEPSIVQLAHVKRQRGLAHAEQGWQMTRADSPGLGLRKVAQQSNPCRVSEDLEHLREDLGFGGRKGRSCHGKYTTVPY